MKDIIAQVGQKWVARDGSIRIVTRFVPGHAWPVATVDETGRGRITHTFDGSVWGAPIETGSDLISVVGGAA